MYKISTKRREASNNQIDTGSQDIHCADTIEEYLEACLYCIKYILNSSIHWPIWNPKHIPMSSTDNEVCNQKIFVRVQVVHCKDK